MHGDKNIAGLSYHNISPLDYFLSQEQGNYLSVIAVGGDKLSRGLTLEGLSISYYLRASKMYDTLMQMGRWFGYRPGYADLCRLFTSQDLIDWFSHITIASEEMRAEFDYMFLLNRTPRDYGLKVRTHPGVLKITAANKFRNKQIMELSYSGELEQSYKFKVDQGSFKNNFTITNDFVQSLGEPTGPLNSKTTIQKLVWCGTKNYSSVVNYLNRFIIGKEVMDVHKITDYVTTQVKNNNLINWTIALISNTIAEENNKVEFVINSSKVKIGLTDRANKDHRSGSYTIAKAMIISPNHEIIDLDDTQKTNAFEATTADWIKSNKKNSPKLPSGFRIKANRNSQNGLLLIYALHHSPLYQIIENETDQRERISNDPIIGIAISFPEIANDEKISYAVNEQFFSDYDYPDELDNEIDEKNRINNIWQQLENNPPDTLGLLKVRYSPDIQAELYLGLLTPALQRCLLLRISAKTANKFLLEKNLKGLKIEKVPDSQNKDFVFLNLILLSKIVSEIFDVLIQDIINVISDLNDEKQIFKCLINRIESWRILFDKTDSEGLSKEAQRGLFGELYFLRKWLERNDEATEICVAAWLGPDKELRDFQISDWALEVKTTLGNNHQKVHISSERQLDTSNLNTLFLYHLSLEAQQQNGESLNQIVDSIIEMLNNNIVTQTQFRSKLLLGGYFTHHKYLYENAGYHLRQESFYIVKDGFPRIEEKDIRNGVGDVKYSIILSDYSDYTITESSAFEIIN